MSAEEELLASLVTREIADDDPRAVEAYARNPELLGTVARLRKLGERLESAGSLERDALEALGEGGPDENEVLQAKIRQQVLGHQAAEPAERVDPETPGVTAAPQPVGTSIRRIAMAAAAVFVVGLAWKLMLPTGPAAGPSGGPTELHLGSKTDWGIQPAIDGGSLLGLSWKEQDLRGGKTYTVRYTAANGQAQVLDTGLYETYLELDDPLSWNEETNLEVLVVGTDKAVISQGSYRN